MTNSMTDLLEAQTSRLALAVRAAFGPACPCCGHAMRVPKGRKEKRDYTGRDRRTIAHDFPVGNGGSYKVWVYACRGCNSDQGDLNFFLWARWLERHGDPRAEKVYRLARFIKDNRRALKEGYNAGTDAV